MKKKNNTRSKTLTKAMYSISTSEIRENYIQYVQMYPLSYKKFKKIKKCKESSYCHLIAY